MFDLFKNLIITFIALSCIKGWAQDSYSQLEKSVVFIYGQSGGTNETFRCTGTAISKKVILTAAHCAYLARDLRVYWKDTIRGRDLRWRNMREKKSIRVRKYEISDSYEIMRQSAIGDIALLYLLEDLPQEVATVDFMKNEELSDSGIILRYGYGKRGVRSRLVLSIGELQTITLDGSLKFFDTNSVQGDSGGPLFMQALDGKWYVAGVHSHSGIRENRGNNTAVFTGHYSDWIKRMLLY